MRQTQLNIVNAFEAGYRVVNGKVISPRGKVRQVHKNKSGYFQFGYKMNDGRVRQVEVHRLVSYEKFGDKIFEPSIQTRHMDNNCLNNLHVNIEIGTPQQNCLDMPVELRVQRALYASSFLKTYDHEAIILRRSQGATYKDIMTEFKIPSKGTVGFILHHSHLAKRTA